MSQQQNIFVVDDEAAARDMIGDYLKMHGFDVTLCDGGPSLRADVEKARPDLVVLDLNMPEEDGLSLIRFLKQPGNVPVIMLTATASPIDRVVGLELGADDYLAKPCEMRELLARVRSVLRRSTAGAAGRRRATPNRTVGWARSGSISTRASLRDEEGNEHPLTASEFGLLKAFAENPKRVLTRERLLDLAQARDCGSVRPRDRRADHPHPPQDRARPRASARHQDRARRRLRVLARRGRPRPERSALAASRPIVSSRAPATKQSARRRNTFLPTREIGGKGPRVISASSESPGRALEDAR